jgi:hypothetical protein
MTSLCVLVIQVAIAAAVDNKPSGEGAKGGYGVGVTIRPRTELVPGRESWYEVSIRNTGSEDEIIDLTTIEVTDVSFVGPKGSEGFSEGKISDKMSPQRCGDVRGWIVLKHDAVVMTLMKVLTPKQIEGAASLRLDLTLRRIVNLTDCASRSIEATYKFPVQIEAAGDRKP